MDFHPSPGSVTAVIVGVENYAVGGDWAFAGPALDAAKFAAWLRARSVPAGNIKLFLSVAPKAPPEHRAEIVATLESCGLALEAALEPSEALVWNWLEFGLLEHVRAAPAGALIDHLVFFWSGHGAIDNDERRLFCSDAHTGSLQNLDFTDFALKLKHRRYRGLRKQVLIVDTCANLYSEMQQTTSLPLHKFSGDREARAEQFAMFAAAYGQFSRNKTARRTGAFFEAMIKRLDQIPASDWPDFEQLLKQVGDDLDDDPKNKQTPVYWHAKGKSENWSNAQPPGGSTRAAPLLEALRELGQPALALWPHFHRACRNATGKPERPNLEKMIGFLDNLPYRSDDTWPLTEFAYRVQRAFPQGPAITLNQWVEARRAEDAAELAAVDQLLNEELAIARARHVTHTLIVQLDAPDAKELQWQLVANASDGSVPPCANMNVWPLPDAVTSEQLAAAIRAMAMSIEDQSNVLAIQLVMSEELLVGGIESVRLSHRDARLASKGLTESLGESYPITLRWNVRATAKHAPKMRLAWQTLGQLLLARLRIALTIEWTDTTPLSAACIDNVITKVREGGGAAVFGLGFGVSTNVADVEDPLLYCLAKGVPYAVWSHDMPAAPQQLREAVATFFGQCQARDFLGQLTDLHDGSVELGDTPALIKVMWDPPPHITRFAQPSPARGGTI